MFSHHLVNQCCVPALSILITPPFFTPQALRCYVAALRLINNLCKHRAYFYKKGISTGISLDWFRQNHDRGTIQAPRP
jgi:hypothetical protein